MIKLKDICKRFAYEEIIVTLKNGHSFQNVNFFPFVVGDQNPTIQHCGNSRESFILNISICLSSQSSFQCKPLNATIPSVT